MLILLEKKRFKFEIRLFELGMRPLLMSICAVAARYAGMEGRRDLEVDVRLWRNDLQNKSHRGGPEWIK